MIMSVSVEGLERIVEALGKIDFKACIKQFFQNVFGEAVQSELPLPTKVELQIQNDEYWIVCMGYVMVCYFEISIYDIKKQIEQLFPSLVGTYSCEKQCFLSATTTRNGIRVQCADVP